MRPIRRVNMLMCKLGAHLGISVWFPMLDEVCKVGANGEGEFSIYLGVECLELSTPKTRACVVAHVPCLLGKCDQVVIGKCGSTYLLDPHEVALEPVELETGVVHWVRECMMEQ